MPPPLFSKHRMLTTVAVAAATTTAFLKTVFSSSTDSEAEDTIKVVRAVVLFRHGDRSPIHPPDNHVLPSSRHQEEAAFWTSKLPTRADCSDWLSNHPISSPTQERIDVGSRPWGQLTQVGAYQARDLGKFLRERLIDQHGILPAKLNNRTVRAHSTSIYRSQHTLQNVLIGLYGKGDRPTCTGTNNRAESQIKIHVTSNPDQQEYHYSPDRNRCLHLAKLHHVLTHPSTMDPMFTATERAVLLKLHALFQYGDQKFATTRVRSTLVCHRSHGHPLPVDVLPSDVRALISANSKMEYKKYSNVNYFKLAVGRLVPRILHGLDDGSGAVKLTLFSGHDSTIKPLTVMLGLDAMDNWPPYCANILIEYGESVVDGSGYVRILYNQTLTPIIGLKCDGNGWVLKSDFERYMRRFGISDFEHTFLCAGNQFDPSKEL